MREFLVSKRILKGSDQFTPAHLIYRIKDGHLLRGQIPLTLRGGLMVIGRVDEIGNIDMLCAQIAAECVRFDFEGAIIALAPIPDNESKTFAQAISDVFTRRKLQLYLPMTYSFCQNAQLLVPGVVQKGKFSEYINQICKDNTPTRLAVELSCAAYEMQLSSNKAMPISQEELGIALSNSGAMTFYSSELVCNYFTFDNSFFIFDTIDTLAEKRKIIEQFGISACIYLISPKNIVALNKLINGEREVQ